MPETVTRTLSLQATLDASGNSPMLDTANSAVCFRATGASWTVKGITVSASSRTKNALCRIFARYVGPTYEVGRTYSGSSGDTNTDQVFLGDGEGLHLVWTGGDPGAVVTALIVVEMEIPRRGFRVAV